MVRSGMVRYGWVWFGMYDDVSFWYVALWGNRFRSTLRNLWIHSWSWMFHQQPFKPVKLNPCLALEATVPPRFLWCALEPTSIVVMWLPLVKRFQRCGDKKQGVCEGAVEGPSVVKRWFYEMWNPREISQETLLTLKRSVWIKKGLPFASMFQVSIQTTLGGQCTDRGLEAGDVRGKVWLKNFNILRVNIFELWENQRINIGWWFQISFIFSPTCRNDPNWLIFFRWVETTNQL